MLNLYEKLFHLGVHVRTLRQKLGDSGRLITTIRNVGYRMDEHPEAGES